MATDSFFAVMCGGLIALLFGLVVCFASYRLFLVLGAVGFALRVMHNRSWETRMYNRLHDGVPA